MNLRDHARAALAHTHVSGVLQEQEPRDRRAYGAIVHHLPVLVHTAGLTAALHFVAGRSKPSQRLVLGQLAAQLQAAGQLRAATAEALLEASRVADLAQLQGLTVEVQRCLLWYKRLVRSLLKIEPGEEGEG